MQNKRLKYLIAALLSLFIGYYSRHSDISFIKNNYFIQHYLGDAIWAMMIYWGFRWFSPLYDARQTRFYALITCFVIEFSQLIQTAFMNSLRSNVFGRLVLGSGFLFSDLVAYTLGILCAFVLDIFFIRK